MGVAVGNTGVGVGSEVLVATGVKDAVGVAVDSGAKVEHAERINVRRKRAMTEGVALFRMGCILTKKQRPRST